MYFAKLELSGDLPVHDSGDGIPDLCSQKTKPGVPVHLSQVLVRVLQKW